MPTSPSISVEGTLEAMGRGGHAIALDPAALAPIGARHGARVRGTLDGSPFRSSLMKRGGTLWLGVHKATIEAAGLAVGAPVAVDLTIDHAPLPADTVPDDLAEALRRDGVAAAAWERLAPSHRRAHVASIVEAVRPQTRARRVDRTMDALRRAAP